MFRTFEKAARYARLGKEMVRVWDIPESVCRVNIAADYFLLPWVRRWEDSVASFFRGFEVGLKHGQPYSASLCLGMSGPFLLISKSLKYSEERLRYICLTQQQIQRDAVHVQWTKPFWQQALNLLGWGDNTLELNGEAMQQGEFLSAELERPLVSNVYRRKLELACYFRSVDRATFYEERIDDAKDNLHLVCPIVVCGRFFRGLTYLDLALKKRTARKYLKKLKRTVRWLTNVVKKGCGDAEPFLKVLTAELSAFNKAPLVFLQKEFDEAIEKALSLGFVGIAAISAERAYFALRDRLDEEEQLTCAWPYWNRALDLYETWEAFGKVASMRETGDEDVGAMLRCSMDTPPSEISAVVAAAAPQLCDERRLQTLSFE